MIPTFALGQFGLRCLSTPAAPVTYATWNSGDKDADLTLSGGNLTFTTVVDNFASVRANQGKDAGKWYWETLDEFTDSYAYCGIAQAGATVTNNWIGAESTSISGPLNFASDDCYRNGAAIATVPRDAGAVVIRHKLDMDAGTYEIAAAGGGFVTVATGLTGTWYPAGTCRQSSGGSGASSTANFGASAFTYSVPGGYNSGVYV